MISKILWREHCERRKRGGNALTVFEHRQSKKHTG